MTVFAMKVDEHDEGEHDEIYLHVVGHDLIVPLRREALSIMRAIGLR